MSSDNKTVDILEWKRQKKKSLIIKMLELKGIEPTDENIEKAEFDYDFFDELKQKINEFNLDRLIDKGITVTHNMTKDKIRLHFPNDITLEIYVDLNSALQTNIISYE